jgi:hypothetical protein
VTVNDDDGGRASDVFTVTVEPPPVFDLPETAVDGLLRGGGRADDPVRPVAVRTETVTTAVMTDSTMFRRRQRLLSPVAEKQLVLRVVLPTGEEDETSEVRLDDDVLDNLRALFAKLPDDHYRIYLIRADGTERQVLDVEVRKGRPLDPEDEQEQSLVRPPAEGSDAASPLGPQSRLGPEFDERWQRRRVPPDALRGVIDDLPRREGPELHGDEATPAGAVTGLHHRGEAPTDSRPSSEQRSEPAMAGGLAAGTGAVVYFSTTRWQERVDRVMETVSKRLADRRWRFRRRPCK